MRWLRRLGNWFDHRLRLRDTLGPILMHPVPPAVAGPMGWWYVLGSASMTLFVLQVATGVGLAMFYVPAADNAYESLLFLNHGQPLGWFLRALHYYAGSGMMVMVLAHMTQVFLHGAYKYPRELTWTLGVVLLLCTLGLFFTGQVLRWDPDAYWGLAVGSAMAGRVPLIGPWLVEMILGGPKIGGDSLSRFFALHVFVIPLVLAASLAGHLWLVLKCGISAPPRPGETVDPATYDQQYEETLRTRGVPFFGEAMLKDAFFSAFVVIVVVVLAAVLGPVGPSGAPNPTLGATSPRPEWPFLWLFAMLALTPPAIETFIILVFPLLLVLALLLVPFLSNRGERAPRRRPVAVLSVIAIYTALGVLTYEGVVAPWSPHMKAWSGDPVPESLVPRDSPLRLQGAAVFQNKSCRNCHALEGVGGRRGPDLTAVGRRLTRNQLIDQISNGTPGGGNMPAYGKQMDPAEMTAVVEFLVGLRPPGEPPAKATAGGQRESDSP